MKRTLFLHSALFFVLIPLFSVQVLGGQTPQTMSIHPSGDVSGETDWDNLNAAFEAANRPDWFRAKEHCKT